MFLIPKKTIPFILRHIFIVFSINAGIAFGQTNWEWANPFPQGSNLFTITYGKGMFVSAGAWGTIITSPDAKNWNVENTVTKNLLLSSASNENGFVIVGEKGTILFSADGKNWEVENSGTTNKITEVVFGDNQFIAVGEKGLILTSSDGVNWSKRNSGTTYDLYCVVYGNGRFIAGTYHMVLTSSNGQDWTADSEGIGKSSLMCITYDGSKFTAIGSSTSDFSDIFISNDGTTWEIGSEYKFIKSSSPDFIRYCKDRYIVLQIYDVQISSDYNTWNNFQFIGPGSAIYAESLFVVVGQNGMIKTSPDCSSWTEITTGITWNHFNAVAYGEGKFVAAGYTFMYSSDGIKWTVQDSETSEINAVTYGKNQFVATGSYGITYTSPDGLNWNRNDLSISSILMSVTYGNGLFVSASNEGDILTSNDGVDWDLKNIVDAQLKSVTYGDGKFVVVGTYGTIFSSEDGTNWTKETCDTTKSLYCVTYGDNQFVAGGGGVFTSPDGKTWTRRNLDSTIIFTGIVYANQQFTAVGHYKIGAPEGVIMTSPDGINWTKKKAISALDLSSIAYGDGRFVVVGTNSTIIRSDADSPLNAKGNFYAKNIENTIKVNVFNDHIAGALANNRSGNCKVKLINISGKMIFTSLALVKNGVFNIPTKTLGAGSYILSITDERKSFTSSFFTLTR